MDQLSFKDSAMAFPTPPFEFLRDPRFPQIRDRLIAGKLALYEGNHLFNRLILEEGRFMCYLAALSLHAAQDMNQPSTWLTLGRLQREVAELGVASRNRVEAQVSYLRKYGFLSQQAHASDRRVRLLQPSPALLARDAAVLGLLMDGLSAFGFRFAAGRTGPPDPDLHRSIRRATLRHLPALGRLIRRHLPLAPFFAHDCGYMILLLLLRGGRDGGETVPTCFQRLATQTGVSRTHVRRIIEAVRDAGLVTSTVRGGHDIRLTPLMWHAADRWFADQFALTAFLLAEARSAPVPANTAV